MNSLSRIPPSLAEPPHSETRSFIGPLRIPAQSRISKGWIHEDSAPQLQSKVRWEEPRTDWAPPSRTILSSGLPASESGNGPYNNQRQHSQTDEREVATRRRIRLHRGSRRFRSLRRSCHGLSLGNQQRSVSWRSWWASASCCSHSSPVMGPTVVMGLTPELRNCRGCRHRAAYTLLL